MSSLSAESRERNFELAFRVAEEGGQERYLDVEDCVAVPCVVPPLHPCLSPTVSVATLCVCVCVCVCVCSECSDVEVQCSFILRLELLLHFSSSSLLLAQQLLLITSYVYVLLCPLHRYPDKLAVMTYIFELKRRFQQRS